MTLPTLCIDLIYLIVDKVLTVPSDVIYLGRIAGISSQFAHRYDKVWPQLVRNGSSLIVETHGSHTKTSSVGPLPTHYTQYSDVKLLRPMTKYTRSTSVSITNSHIGLLMMTSTTASFISPTLHYNPDLHICYRGTQYTWSAISNSLYIRGSRTPQGLAILRVILIVFPELAGYIED